MKARKMAPLDLKTVDLFAGGGGLSAGFAKEGFEIVAAYELWEPAANCHE
ncbi:MAG: DNA cytosine methyltransferase, partial [Deltaproteobacteria bacterium]|nr:DNA cytosine methyltransferase [Deltaproteobacteria bacterium]